MNSLTSRDDRVFSLRKSPVASGISIPRSSGAGSEHTRPSRMFSQLLASGDSFSMVRRASSKALAPYKSTRETARDQKFLRQRRATLCSMVSKCVSRMSRHRHVLPPGHLQILRWALERFARELEPRAQLFVFLVAVERVLVFDGPGIQQPMGADFDSSDVSCLDRLPRVCFVGCKEVGSPVHGTSY